MADSVIDWKGTGCRRETSSVNYDGVRGRGVGRKGEAGEVRSGWGRAEDTARKHVVR